MENNDKIEFSQRLKDKMEADLEKHGIEIVSDPSEILGDYENEEDDDAVVLSPGMLPTNIRKRAEEMSAPPAPKGFHYEDGILMMDNDEEEIQESMEEKPSEKNEEKSNSNLWSDSDTREFDFYNSKITRDIPKNVIKFLFCLATRRLRLFHMS